MSACPSQLGSCARARWSGAAGASGRPRCRGPTPGRPSSTRSSSCSGRWSSCCARWSTRPWGCSPRSALGAAGTLAFVALRATEPPVLPGADGRTAARRWPRPACAALDASSMLCVGVLFGTVEVSMVAFAEERGSASGGGLLLALVAGGQRPAGLAVRRRCTGGRSAHRRCCSDRLAGRSAWSRCCSRRPSLVMAPAALLAGLRDQPDAHRRPSALVEELVPASRPHRGLQLAELRARASASPRGFAVVGRGRRRRRGAHGVRRRARRGARRRGGGPARPRHARCRGPSAGRQAPWPGGSRPAARPRRPGGPARRGRRRSTAAGCGRGGPASRRPAAAPVARRRAGGWCGCSVPTTWPRSPNQGAPPTLPSGLDDRAEHAAVQQAVRLQQLGRDRRACARTSSPADGGELEADVLVEAARRRSRGSCAAP